MTKNPTVTISDAFDGGNIELVGQTDANGHGIMMDLSIKEDPYTQLEKVHHFQYFAFRATVSGLEQGRKIQVHFSIQNASKASFPYAWKGSSVFYGPSLEEDEDTNAWRRNLGTQYDETKGTLTWTQTFERNGSLYFAYFPPYTYQSHLNLVANCAANPMAEVTSLGQSLDGREMDLIKIGTGKRIAWITARQHPGETMASYYIEGLLKRLLGLDGTRGEEEEEEDRTVRTILKEYTLYIVPCVCPDGAVRGYLRTNACGANLNREWATVDEHYPAPSLERSPEVYYVLQKMTETGVDIFLDIHGDEDLPVNFLAGAQGIPNWDQRLESLHGAFAASYVRSNSDMQQHVGYTPQEPPQVLINTACKVVANRFDCVAFTLEMPFKDCATNPDPERGWSPNRSQMLGASVLEPLLYVRPYLRAKGEFWKELSAQDSYVHPAHKTYTYGPNNEVLDY